jgi:ribosome-binding protein aMBF1 (putative translation factor)
MSKSNFFTELVERIPNHINKFVSLSSDISHHIEKNLQSLNLTKNDLAEELNVNIEKIDSMLNGRYNFDIKTLIKIEEYFKIKKEKL